MIYRFTIVSDEADNFLREIKIDADATFLDLCKAVLASCNYSDDQITSFYITNDEWEKISEVTREDMGTSYSDEDVYVMEDTRLRDVIEEEHQRMMFIFDTFEQRALYMELKEIIPGTNLKEAAVSRSRSRQSRKKCSRQIPTAERIFTAVTGLTKTTWTMKAST